MTTLLRLISYTGLALTVLPALFVFSGTLSLERYHTLATVGMVLWFATAVLWIKPEKTEG